MSKKSNPNKNERPNITVTGSNYADHGGNISGSTANSGILVNWQAKSIVLGWIGGIITSIIASYIWENFLKK
jgi:hypothetical protein